MTFPCPWRPGTREEDISLTLKTSLFCLVRKIIMTQPMGGTQSSGSANSSRPSEELPLPSLPNSYPCVLAHSNTPFSMKLIFTPQVD